MYRATFVYADFCRSGDNTSVEFQRRIRVNKELLSFVTPVKQRLKDHVFDKFVLWIFIRPSSDGTYYGMVMSVRVSIRVSVRPSGLRPPIFRTFLLHALTYWAQILHMTLFWCTVKHLFFAWPYFREVISQDLFTRLYFRVSSYIIL